MTDSKTIQFSLVIPVYKNEADIRDLVNAINTTIVAQIKSSFEIIFVIDGSPDLSRDLLRALLPQQPWASQLVVLSRNFGTFSAIRTGFTLTKGRAIAVMAADLQDPAALVPQLWDILARDEADVVCAERGARQDGAMARIASAIYWWIYRKTVFAEAPKGGVSMFAINGRVREIILSIPTTNKSMFSLVMSVGFRRKFIPYVRQARRNGHSAYTLNRKLIFAIDSLVSFSDLPILLLIWLTLAGPTISALAGLAYFIAWYAGLIATTNNVPIVLLAAFAFAALFLSQGLLGLFLWRIGENTKQRPPAIVSEHNFFEGTGPDSGADTDKASSIFSA